MRSGFEHKGIRLKLKEMISIQGRLLAEIDPNNFTNLTEAGNQLHVSSCITMVVNGTPT
jgi:hypothetical protein